MRRQLKALGSTVVATLALSGLLLVAGCEERPYPGGDKSYGEAPKAPPPAALAGAPVAPPPPAYAPPPAAYAPPPPAAYGAPPPARYYDSPAIVAMAPIPNPGEPGSDGYYSGRGGYGPRVHSHLYASPPPAYAAPRPPVHAPPVYAPKPPVYAAKPPVYAPKPVAPPKPPVYAAKPAPPKTYAGPVVPPPVKPYVPPKDYKPAPPPVAVVPPPAPAKPATYAKAPAAPAPAAPSGDRAAHIAALTTALTDAVSKGAVLTAPDRFTANQPADVSLTLPVTFADTLAGEAQKDGLADAAASVNMTAVASGDGFSVTPDETQSQPLTKGEPTVFHWTVTAQPGAKGPLHVDVGADLLGGGNDTLALGSVQKQAGLGVKPTPRMIGAAILVLILALVVVWLARGRTPARSATARRASRAARTGRPLDMGGGAAPSSHE